MKPQWGLFLFLSLVVMALCLGLGGAWLLPMMGVQGVVGRMIAAGIAGAIIAILYLKLIKGFKGA